MTSAVDLALLVGAVVLLVAVVAVRLSTRLGLPSLLVYLLIGLALGEAGFGVQFENVELTRSLGFVALVLIIAEGGLTTRLSVVRPVLVPAGLLATVGVFVSTGVLGVLVHLLLDIPLLLALLYGAVLSSTDAAAVFSTLRRARISPRLGALLEAESGMNDPPAVILVVTLSTMVVGGHSGPLWQEGLLVLVELAVGALVGLAVGLAGAYGLRRVALPAAGLYPLAAVGLTVLAYGVGEVLHASGFLAVYVAGVVLGNARIPHRQAVLGFADGVAWLGQIGLFVLLGLLASPSRLPGAILPALIVGTAALLVVRPLAVVLSVSWLRVLPGARRRGWGFTWREHAFVSWAGLRGAIPIVLATVPLSLGVAGAERLFDVVFVLVVIYTVLQGGTIVPVARWLRLSAPEEPTDLRVEVAPLERMRADLLQVTVPPKSHLIGVYIDELRLPPGAVVTLVLRNGAGFVPDPRTRLRAGDELLIVATDEVRDATERRLRAVGRRGRLARWLGETG
ncbi:MAG: potassium/proton antiporter [Micromonosporaceae bacterium]|nr:potassium/proton antiporter [Micromonosporaceae bacterium]